MKKAFTIDRWEKQAKFDEWFDIFSWGLVNNSNNDNNNEDKRTRNSKATL